MRKNRTAKTQHFTVFRSAAEEVKERQAMNEWLDMGRLLLAESDQVVANGKSEKDCDASAKDTWANEGGHMHAKSGYIVQTSPGAFKVVLNHEGGDDTEQSCATIREGEAFIRRNTPTPPERDTSRDHEGTTA
jgi:hypothetical protein